MADDLTKALEDTKASLHEEARDLQQRADNLEWAELEKIFRSEGMDDEDIELERQMFETTMRIIKMLSGQR